MKFPSLSALLITTALATAAPPRGENTVVLDALGVNNLGIETIAVEESPFERTIVVLGEIEHTCESH
jgi:hypothetical protein